jgi:ribosomal protein S18 acetylase RimI-like enzyme
MSDLPQAVRAREHAPRRRGEAVAPRARRAEAADVSELSRLLAAAFFDDPVFGWCYPDPAPRREILPAVFRTFIAACQAGDEIYTTEDHLAGAVCVPPGQEPDDAQLTALEEISGEYAPRTFELSELMAAEHPHEPHYYLFFLGTRPQWQSRGIGSALLEQLLEPCDRDGIPAYLDATSERNKRLYLRHGFEVSNEVRLPGGAAFWPMWRMPK